MINWIWNGSGMSFIDKRSGKDVWYNLLRTGQCLSLGNYAERDIMERILFVIKDDNKADIIS